MKKIKVLSLFDGMACTRIALDKLGYKNVEYYASEIDQYGMKVAKDNYPDIIHIGDVKNIDKKFIKSLGEVDLMIGGSPCFPAGTLVFTRTGYKPMEQLLIGEEVLTHKGRSRKILDWGYKVSNNLIKIKCFGLDEVISTNNHPFYVRLKQPDGKFSEPFWEKAENLTKKHYLSTTPILEKKEESLIADKYNIQMNKDFAYFMGRFLADGWILKTKRLRRKNSFLYKTYLCCGFTEFNEIFNVQDISFVFLDKIYASICL